MNTLYMILWWSIHVTVHLCKPTKCTTSRVNPHVNCRFWVILVCQCTFINHNVSTTLVGDIDNGRGLDGHASEQALGVGDGQGSLACYSPQGSKESDTTEWLNWTELTDVWEQKIYKKPLYLLPYFCCEPKTSRKKIKPIIKKKPSMLCLLIP